MTQKIYTATNLTREEIYREWRRTTLVSVGADCTIALKIDARTANGQPPSEAEVNAALARIAQILNARDEGVRS